MDSGSRDGGSSGRRFPIQQADRDSKSYWEVDITMRLEEYLLKICSGEITARSQARTGPLCQLRRRYGDAEDRGFLRIVVWGVHFQGLRYLLGLGELGIGTVEILTLLVELVVYGGPA
jgi:hypothetical protein